MRAVQNRAFLSVPFSGSTLGVRIGALAYNLAEAMDAIVRGKPLPSIDFTNVVSPGGEGEQAVTNSGVKAYTKLPTYEGTDLEVFCPGTSNIVIQDILADEPTTTSTADDTDNYDSVAQDAVAVDEDFISTAYIVDASIVLNLVVIMILLIMM